MVEKSCVYAIVKINTVQSKSNLKLSARCPDKIRRRTSILSKTGEHFLLTRRVSCFSLQILNAPKIPITKKKKNFTCL